MQAEIITYSDGGIGAKNAGIGAVVQARTGAILALGNRTLPLMTNNEAEYAALLLAMELVLPFADQAIEVRMDSEIVVNQMRGYFSINSGQLKTLNRQAGQMALHFPKIAYKHIPRAANQLANALASDATVGRQWILER